MIKKILKLVILFLVIVLIFVVLNINLVENGLFEVDEISERFGIWQFYNEFLNWSSSESVYFEV